MSTDRDRDWTAVLVLVALAVLLFPVLAMLAMMSMMALYRRLWFGGHAVGLQPILSLGLSLLWLVVLAGAGYLAYRWFAQRSAARRDADTALEELRLAYARGELTDEEFDARRERLTRER